MNEKQPAITIKQILMLAILAGAAIYLALMPQQESAVSEIANAVKSAQWPPRLGQSYPDLTLIDQRGKTFRISDYKGKVIIIEPIGMNCPACQAFSGAHEVGSYKNNDVQSGLPSIKKLMPRYANDISLPHKDIVFIQLLLYDMKLEAPTAQDAKDWAKHFGFKKGDNEIVAISTSDMRSNASYKLIPGFQLIDKDFVLRSDSTGHHPRDSLYKTLLPMVPSLL